MLILDPETTTAIKFADGHIIYNAHNKNIAEVDPQIMSCELSDTNPSHNNLLIAGSLFYGREYQRFIDFARWILGNDTVFLREWEEKRSDLREKDFDRHQQLGTKRVQTMLLVFNQFISKLEKNSRLFKLSSAVNRLRCSQPGDSFDFAIDFSQAKQQFFNIYAEETGVRDFNTLNDLATKKYFERAYIQNWWSRRLYNTKALAIEVLVPDLTAGKTNTMLGWLIHSSVHDTALYVADYLSQLLAPYNGRAWVSDYQCVNVLMGEAVKHGEDYKLGILDTAKNPDMLFKDGLSIDLR